MNSYTINVEYAWYFDVYFVQVRGAHGYRSVASHSIGRDRAKAEIKKWQEFYKLNDEDVKMNRWCRNAINATQTRAEIFADRDAWKRFINRRAAK